jgi:hypothetical protein
MKKVLAVTASLVLLAAACNQPAQVQGNVGSIDSISITPVTESSGWLMYDEGAVVKVVGSNLTSVEILYWSSSVGMDDEKYPDGQSLGQAISLSSQPNTWALALPKGLMGTNLWAVAVDSSGKKIESQYLGNFAYDFDKNVRATESWQTYTYLDFTFKYPKDFQVKCSNFNTHRLCTIELVENKVTKRTLGLAIHPIGPRLALNNRITLSADAELAIIQNSFSNYRISARTVTIGDLQGMLYGARLGDKNTDPYVHAYGDGMVALWKNKNSAYFLYEKKAKAADSIFLNILSSFKFAP